MWTAGAIAVEEMKFCTAEDELCCTRHALFSDTLCCRKKNKKLSYRRGTAAPRDASCQLKSCQLPRNSAETTCTTSPEQIEVMKSEGYSGPMCNIHVHSTGTRSSRFHCPVGVINNPTTGELWISPVYRRLAVAKFFLRPQYRNCSRDPDHAHLGNTHSSQD